MKLITLLLSLALAQVASAQTKSLYDIPLKDIDGKDTSLKAYQGKVLLVVNVATYCGNTPQGFTVLGFPCNDFGAQEPGTPEEIKTFCSKTYSVSFPLFEKLHVKGAEQHPLYTDLTGPGSPFPGDVKWNFGKFLIGRDGKIIKRFEPGVKPDTTAVVSAVEAAIAAK